jgi:amidohydrolase
MPERSEFGSEVFSRALEVSARVQEIREDIHRHPELRFEEHRTSGLCADELEHSGIRVSRGVGGIGVVGILSMGEPADGPVVGFRAEMDALAMDDLCGKPYASLTPGVAHLCGHDGHVAALLGAASVLASLRARLPGTVKFMFEPSEEATPPGEACGAEAMIADGALGPPTPQAIFGSHFYPDWPAGSVAVRPGVVFTGNDMVRLRIKGRESHSAVPHEGIDAVYVAGQVIVATQGLVSHLDIEEAVSVHWSTVHGGRMPNLIAEEVVLEGSFRYSDQSLRQQMKQRVEDLVKGICGAFGASYEIDFGVRPMPAVINSEIETEIVIQAAVEGLGRKNVINMGQPRLAADTMFHWLHERPGVFYMVGTAGVDPSTRYPSHHQKFDIDPAAFPAAVTSIVMTAFRFLEQAQKRTGGRH